MKISRKCGSKRRSTWSSCVRSMLNKRVAIDGSSTNTVLKRLHGTKADFGARKSRSSDCRSVHVRLPHVGKNRKATPARKRTMHMKNCLRSQPNCKSDVMVAMSTSDCPEEVQSMRKEITNDCAGPCVMALLKRSRNQAMRLKQPVNVNRTTRETTPLKTRRRLGDG